VAVAVQLDQVVILAQAALAVVLVQVVQLVQELLVKEILAVQVYMVQHQHTMLTAAAEVQVAPEEIHHHQQLVVLAVQVLHTQFPVLL
jgi:hypothetical protein